MFELSSTSFDIYQRIARYTKKLRTSKDSLLIVNRSPQHMVNQEGSPSRSSRTAFFLVGLMVVALLPMIATPVSAGQSYLPMAVAFAVAAWNDRRSHLDSMSTAASPSGEAKCPPMDDVGFPSRFT